MRHGRLSSYGRACIQRDGLLIPYGDYCFTNLINMCDKIAEQPGLQVPLDHGNTVRILQAHSKKIPRLVELDVSRPQTTGRMVLHDLQGAVLARRKDAERVRGFGTRVARAQSWNVVVGVVAV